jgi:hypothetical protein
VIGRTGGATLDVTVSQVRHKAKGISHGPVNLPDDSEPSVSPSQKKKKASSKKTGL